MILCGTHLFCAEVVLVLRLVHVLQCFHLVGAGFAIYSHKSPIMTCYASFIQVTPGSTDFAESGQSVSCSEY